MRTSELLAEAQPLLSLLRPFDGLFDNFLFHDWRGSVFARATWTTVTNSLSVGLSLVVSGLLLLEQRARRLGRSLPEKRCRRVGVAITVVGFLLYFDFFVPNTRYENYYHRHELYHYYLGSKYFTEVGYKRLYACTVIAEVELGLANHVRTKKVRNLAGDNLLESAQDTYVFKDPDQCKRHFTQERWGSFKSDVAWFEKSARGDYWDRMTADHGYNPPPVWTMTGKLFSSLAPPSDHFFKVLASLDIMLQLGALLMLDWAFGWRVMTIAAVFFGCNLPANIHWTCGAFLRQDWYFLFMAAICLARKRRFGLSGAALAWSSLLRVFPVVAFTGVALIMAFHWLRHRTLHRDHLRFAVGAALAGTVLMGASVAVTGMDSYPDFVSHIRGHKSTPLTNNMGLEMIVAHDWSGRMVFTRDERLADDMSPWMGHYSERVKALRPVILVVSLGVFAWMAWALRRIKRLWVGIILSIPLLMSVLCLTCYYYAFFFAVPALTVLVPAIGPAYLAVAAGSQVLTRFYWIDDEYTAESYLFFVFGLCLLYAVSRPLDVARLRAWWRGRPDTPSTAHGAGRGE
jgi:uncharacterized protein YjeT (DUF2065 family)